MGFTVPEPSVRLSVNGILFHKSEVLSLGKLSIEQRPIPQLLADLHGLLPFLVCNLPALMVLANRTRAGFVYLEDGVLGILFFLLIHRVVLTASVVQILRSHAVAILGLAGISSQKISSAVLAFAWGMAVVHTV